MNTQEMHPFEQVLHGQYGGVIRVEEKEGAACALEAASVARGRPFSDKPSDAGLPDLSPLSDGNCIWPDDQTRTEHLVPVVKALWTWPRWSNRQRSAWKQRVIKRTIGEILPLILRPIGLEAEAERCAREGTARATIATRIAAEKLRKAALREQNATLMLDAIRVRETANDAIQALNSKDVFYTAITAYSAATAAHCMAIGRTTTSASSEVDTARFKVSGASAEDILALACLIWRVEAERIRPLRSH